MNDQEPPDAEPAFVAGDAAIVRKSGAFCRIIAPTRLKVLGRVAGWIYELDRPPWHAAEDELMPVGGGVND